MNTYRKNINQFKHFNHKSLLLKIMTSATVSSPSLRSIENTTKISELSRSYSENGSLNDAKSEPLWIFGYGSLIWKPNFVYRQKLVGKINGFSRKFWQGSTDHRGVPGKPGRVATLIEENNASTWGVAFEVMPDNSKEVLMYLNFRERGGYSVKNILFHPEDSRMAAFPVTVYIAGCDNEEYLGEAPLMDIAVQIARSVGTSGENSEYLYNLAQALRELHLDQHDDHIFELESILKQLHTNNKENK